MAQVEHATAQIRLNRGVIISEGIGPCIIWVPLSRARMLIDAGAATAIEQPNIGPSEIKPEAPTEKKSLTETQDGPLTDSAPLETSGLIAQSSASVAAQASQPRKSQQSNRRTKNGK